MALHDGEEERPRSVGLQNAQSILSARQHAEEILRQHAELLRITLASIGDAVISTDADGRITLMNRVAESLTGWSQADAIGRPLPEVFQVVSERTRQPVENPALRALSQGTIVGLANHTILIARDGSELPIDDSAAPIHDGNGSTVGVVLVFRDITERKQAEKDQARLAAIVESSDDAILSKSLDGTILSWNTAAERLFGYTPPEAIGKNITLIIPSERLDEERMILERLCRGERIDHFETVRVAKDGRRIHISLTISPIRSTDGQIIGASKIARDITKRIQGEKQLRGNEDRLRQLAADLSEANRRKDEFLATLAHELRNPLAPIHNGLQIMRASHSNQPAVQQAGAMMERQLGNLVRLVDDLLDVSRISRGKLELRKERVELAAVLNNAVETSLPLIESSRNKLTVSVPPEPIFVDADVVRLGQVFANLLNNAAKYSEPGGHVWLTAERQGSDVVVRVKDTGVGIPADMLAKIFDLFTQVDRSLERSQSGLGVGLTLVKRVVELHGGTVHARSEELGKGSEFIVRLPVAVPALSDLKPPPDTVQPSRLPLHCRILVADDNKDSATSLAMLLTIMGHEVRTANDGMQALELAAAFRPDVILLDIGMPKLNGYETCRRIRAETWGSKPILIALTGWGQVEDKRRSAEAGFNYHLVKPIDTDALQMVLADLQAVAVADASGSGFHDAKTTKPP